VRRKYGSDGSGGGRDGLNGDLVAKAFQATDEAALDGGAVASVEVLRPSGNAVQTAAASDADGNKS
jgi:hypothetical protein